ncbi:hypothetical protein BH20VER1_BH20VER1_20370 [soil metagenome]
MRHWRFLAAVGLLSLVAGVALAQEPYGLESRAPIAPYLNHIMPPRAGAFPFPQQLSATGAFRDLRTLTPAEGLIPFAVNSPLWTDGAIKTRWMAVPNDGPPYSAAEQIGFAPVGEWTFPDGTVFVKQFDLTVNEATGERRRLETRLLVRNADGGVYGVTYKWRPDQTEADLLPDGLEEDIAITTASGATRIQRYSYPSRADCLTCHNAQARFVLGPKTHQLNGRLTYPETGRTDNQLRTLNHLGLLNPPQDEMSFASFMRSVSVTSTTATVQHRMRSWIDANCSHCHRPGGIGPGYDGRLSTPLENQNLIGTYVRFRNLAGSQLYLRDNDLGAFKMPPIAKNVVHESAMAALRQWIASPFEVLSVTLHEDGQHLAVRFNSRVAPASVNAANFSLNQGAIITAAAPAAAPDVVILSVSGLNIGQTYELTTSEVHDTAPSANTIWPRSRHSFAAQFEAAPPPKRLANISSRGSVTAGQPTLIGGFIARGAGTKRVLLRAIGPSLAASGLTGVLADPVVELFDSTGTAITMNNDWEENANRQEISDTGIAPSSPQESVLIARLPASSSGTPYTVVLRGASGSEGVGLVEIFDLDRTAGSELVNLSTRAAVATGDHVLIGGFIITGTEAQKVIIRAIGPSLPLAGRLLDPQLQLHDSQGALLQSNDNWRTGQEAEIIATSVPPPDDREAAIVRTLGPGAYTAIVRGAGGATGVALVEVFALP